MDRIPRPEYPRPQFVRKEWLNLNGVWTCEFDPGRSGVARGLCRSAGFTQTILVPFCPESKLSGVEHKDFIEQMFYHRKIAVPAEWTGKRILLHFDAIDYESAVYIDGKQAGTHFGGGTPFTVDITDAAAPGTEHDLVVMVRDFLRSGVQPGGKQCEDYYSAGVRYTRTTGIWQTVWMEPVDPFALKTCRITPDLDNASFSFSPEFFNDVSGLRWHIRVLAGDEVVGEGVFGAATRTSQTIRLKKVRAWSPQDPFLYDIEFTVMKDGKTIDRVRSYSGLRKVHIEGDRFFLNDTPLFFRFVLDQGFYPDGIWTAPSDEDLRRDIELSMAAGFNGARLHQKVFEPRFHYWADKLGYLTWGESASGDIFFCDHCEFEDSVSLWKSFTLFLNEWREAVERDVNHPSIIAWTPANETGESRNWELARRLFTIIYDTTKSLDPTRPVNDCSGYRHVKTDLWTVHVYRKNAQELKEALETKPVFMKSPPFEKVAYHGQPYINDEFGGFLYLPPDKTSRFAQNTWGYYELEIKTPEEYIAKIAEQAEFMRSMPGLSGFCFTQLTDIEQEQNGVLTFDRTPKVPLKALHKAFAGE